MFDKQTKKTVFTLAVDGYPEAITRYTFPYMQKYAESIGAGFHVIRERRFPGWPAAYEKLQIHRLAQEMGNDWNLFFDADTMIHPELPDLTQHLPLNHVSHYQVDSAGVRFKYDRIFSRDGRNIGSCNWLAIASYQCIELWKPLEDVTPAEVAARIRPTVGELEAGITPEHLTDDYALSRNIALYGLKFMGVAHILRTLDLGNLSFFVHNYKISQDAKVDLFIQTLRGWRQVVPDDYYGNDIKGWMTLAEMQWLYHRAKRYENVAEIGSWMGRSTHALASSGVGMVYAVDHFKGSPGEHETTHAEADTMDIAEVFKHNMAEFSNIEIVRADCVETAARFENKSIDMVFIDADHSFDGAIQSIRAWAPKARRVLCGHDRRQEGVPHALQALKIPVTEHAESIWSCEVENLPAALR